MPEVGLAAAVVVFNDHVLIVRRSRTEGFLPGRWGVPSGKIDKGEDSRQAVLRELYEETGLHGTVVDWVGQSMFLSIWRGQEVKNVQDNYLVNACVDADRLDQAGMPRVRLPKADQEARWVLRSEIDHAGLDQHNRITIEQGLERLKGVSQPAR